MIDPVIPLYLQVLYMQNHRLKIVEKKFQKFPKSRACICHVLATVYIAVTY